jgi:dienelactone hydrolase
MCVVVLAAGIGAATPVPASDEPGLDAVRLALYDYESKLPLDVSLGPAPAVRNEPAKLRALRKRYRVTFMSAHDQRVPGILAMPAKGSGARGAVIILAGSGGHKDTDYVRIASDMLNTEGIATLSIDAQYHGERARKARSGDIHFVQNPTNRDAWIQTVQDLRRSVDYLASRRDIDRTRIGFLGFSQGAMLGATFLGVEPRIKAACLAVPGGGFVAWAKTLGIGSGADEAQLRTGAALTDPIHFIGRFSPRPLLVLAARKDELIPAAATQAIVSAAKEPTRVIWYNSGHVLPPNALIVDVRAFFGQHIAKR